MLDATDSPEPASPYAAPPKSGPYRDEVGRNPGRLRIAWSAESPNGKPVDPEIQAALENTVRLLQSLGHSLVPRGLGVDYRGLYGAQRKVGPANFGAAMARRIGEVGREPAPDELEPLTWSLLEAGRKVTGAEAFSGWQTMRVMSREILVLFEEFDAYLCPVLGTTPPEIGYIDPVKLEPREVQRRQAIVFPFTPPFNFTGQPCISLPLWQSHTGLPIGMMFAGRYADEATLFRLAGQLEKEIPWSGRRPAIWN
jgi:amidase